jgi:hypothetical protein
MLVLHFRPRLPSIGSGEIRIFSTNLTDKYRWEQCINKVSVSTSSLLVCHAIFCANTCTSKGDIISLTTPFETSVVVNTIELATELLEKQAVVTANRPRNVMVQEMYVSSYVRHHQH